MSIRTQLLTIAGLGLVWMSLTAWYVLSLSPETVGGKDIDAVLKKFLESLSAFGVLSTILFSAFTSLEASASRREQTKALEATLKQTKLDRSVDCCRRWNDERFGIARDLIRKYYLDSSPQNQEQFARQIEASAGMHRSFVCVLGYFGEISDSIDLGMIEESVVQRAFENTFTRIYELSLPWMQTHTPLTCKDLEKLYLRWKVPVNQVKGELRTPFNTAV